MTLATARSSVTLCWHLGAASGDETDVIASKVLVETSGTIASAAGKLANARDFEADDTEYFALADCAEVSFADEYMMVALWVKPETVATYTMLFRKGASGGSREYTLYGFADGSLAWEVPGGIVYGAAGSISVGNWSLLCVKHDPVANVIGISVNGGAWTETGYSTGLTDGAGEFQLGASDDQALYYDGLAEELIFMRGYCLSNAEVAELYNRGYGITLDDWIGDLSAAVPFAVAVYPLDEASGTRYDSVGSNNLADSGSTAIGTGMFGNAADFEVGAPTVLSITDNVALSAGDVKLSIRFWFKPESIDATYGILIKGNGIDDATNYEYEVLGGTSGGVVFSVSDGTTRTFTANNDGTISAGNWYLIHAWHDPDNNEIGLTVNAGTPSIGSTSTGVWDNNKDFRLGGESEGTRPYDGLLDDVVILKGYLLSSTQRTADYNGGAGIPFRHWLRDTLSLAVPYAVACWTLDEASGTRADSVGSNDLSDNNTVASATGLLGSAADFESGNSEWLSVAHGNDLDFGDEDFQFSLYFKLESVGAFGAVLLGKATLGVTNNYVLFVDTDNVLKWKVTLPGVTEQQVAASTFGALSTGVWYSATAWHDAINNLVGVSVNGTKDTASYSSGTGDSNLPFMLGNEGGSAFYFYDGLLDDVVVLAGYLFSDAQRTEHHNGGAGVAFADWAGAPAAGPIIHQLFPTAAGGTSVWTLTP